MVLRIGRYLRILSENYSRSPIAIHKICDNHTDYVLCNRHDDPLQEIAKFFQPMKKKNTVQLLVTCIYMEGFSLYGWQYTFQFMSQRFHNLLYLHKPQVCYRRMLDNARGTYVHKVGYAYVYNTLEECASVNNSCMIPCRTVLAVARCTLQN